MWIRSAYLLVLLVVALLLTGGCTHNDADVYLNPDGSGYADFTVTIPFPKEEAGPEMREAMALLFPPEVGEGEGEELEELIATNLYGMFFLSNGMTPEEWIADILKDFDETSARFFQDAEFTNMTHEVLGDRIRVQGRVSFKNYETLFTETTILLAPPPLVWEEGRVWLQCARLAELAFDFFPKTSNSEGPALSWHFIPALDTADARSLHFWDSMMFLMAFGMIEYRQDTIRFHLPWTSTYTRQAPLAHIEEGSHTIHYAFHGKKWLKGLARIFAPENDYTWMAAAGYLPREVISYQFHKLFMNGAGAFIVAPARNTPLEAADDPVESPPPSGGATDAVEN